MRLEQPRFFLAALPLLVASLVGGCQSTSEGRDSSWAATPFNFVSTGGRPSPGNGAAALPGGTNGSGTPPPLYYRGSGQMVGSGSSPLALPEELSSGGPVTLNLSNAPIDAAAKAVLADTFKLDYSIDPGVSGKVTIQTSSPISRSDLVRLFQNALAANGAAIVRNGSVYRIVTTEQARSMPGPVQVGGAQSGSSGAQIGAGMRVVPLKYVSASQMQRILEPMIGRSSIVATDDERNTITLSGDGQDIDTVLRTISIFDVDIMKGKSVLAVTVRAPPDAIVADLKGIFGADKGGMKGMVQFLPNERLKSILVVSSQPAYLAKAEMWIKRLDSRAQGNDKQLFTYKVQNRPAKELVDIINDMFSSGKTGGSAARNVAPRYQEASVQSSSDPAATGQGLAIGQGGALASDAAPATPGSPSSNGEGTDMGAERVKVTADESDNSLLIMATGGDYKRVLAIIKTLDMAPRQVLIEATIAEVSLTDDLKFGVRWYFQGKRAGYQFTDAASKAFGSVFPGFSYAWQAANVQATLNALNEVTKVNIVSAPSLMVVDNKPATLQIGDQVPILTQSASGVLTPGAPIVNSVSYRDTGVILTITPRINDSGRVLLDVQQEVSSVADTKSSTINSPTIKQRKVRTTVMVSDNEALALGGIIQTQTSTGHTQVPILGDIPVLGNAFKSKTDYAGKTELIVLITPHVVHDPQEAAAVTDEYRRRLNVYMPSPRSVNHSIGKTLRKVIVE